MDIRTILGKLKCFFGYHDFHCYKFVMNSGGRVESECQRCGKIHVKKEGAPE